MTRRGAKLRVAGGQVFVQLSSAKGSGKGAITRERNVCEHPLVRLRATGKISEAQYQAADRYRELHEILRRSGVDSTQRIAISGGQTGWSEAQCDAESRLRRIESRLGRVNCLILRGLCADGLSPRRAVLKAVRTHPNAIMSRLHEALDDLERATTTV